MWGEKQCKSISPNILDAITFLPDNTDFFRWCNTKIKSFFSSIIYFIKRVFTWDPKWNLPEVKFQPTIKGILFTLLFIAGEMKWISFRGWSEINGPLSKSQSFLLTHAQMFPFIWFHFSCCLHDILSPEVKFHFCQNDRNEITPATSFSSGCIM